MGHLNIKNILLFDNSLDEKKNYKPEPGGAAIALPAVAVKKLQKAQTYIGNLPAIFILPFSPWLL